VDRVPAYVKWGKVWRRRDPEQRGRADAEGADQEQEGAPIGGADLTRGVRDRDASDMGLAALATWSFCFLPPVDGVAFGCP
jgi:hypothetical protein